MIRVSPSAQLKALNSRSILLRNVTISFPKRFYLVGHNCSGDIIGRQNEGSETNLTNIVTSTTETLASQTTTGSIQQESTTELTTAFPDPTTVSTTPKPNPPNPSTGIWSVTEGNLTCILVKLTASLTIPYNTVSGEVIMLWFISISRLFALLLSVSWIYLGAECICHITQQCNLKWLMFFGPKDSRNYNFMESCWYAPSLNEPYHISFWKECDRVNIFSHFRFFSFMFPSFSNQGWNRAVSCKGSECENLPRSVEFRQHVFW